MSDTLRAVIFREGDAWIAQGLERDICAQGKSLDEVVDRFVLTVELEEKEGSGWLGHIPPAPQRYFRMAETGGSYLPVGDQAANNFRFNLAA